MTKCTETCDAEKAVLVNGLKDAIRILRSAREALPEHPDAYMGGASEWADDLEALLANTSPAAAALLARGERVEEALKNMKCPGCVTLVGEPNNRLRCPDCFDARAALATGEEKDGD
jgi:hypothetical protein